MLQSVFVHSSAHVLKRADNSCLGLSHLRTPYVLAFPTRSLALKISRFTNSPNDISMTNHVTTNLLAGATMAQKELWRRLRDTTANDAFHVDFSAHVTFAKSVIPVTEMCTMQEEAMDDLLMYPFNNNLGLVLIRRVIEELPETGSVVTEAVVLDACTHPGDFKLVE